MRRIALVVLAAGCGACGSATPPERQPPVTSLATSPTRPGPDAEDRDPALRRRARAASVARPALQHLPWVTERLTIAIEDVTADGRLVLLVRGGEDGRRDYRAFLRRFGDDGRAYLPRFSNP